MFNLTLKGLKMKNYLVVLFASALSLFGISAFAALPAGVATGFTDIQTNMQGVFDLALPVVILGVVLMLVIKLMKKFANKV